VVQFVGHELSKLEMLGSIPGRSHRRLENGTCGLSSLVLGADETGARKRFTRSAAVDSPPVQCFIIHCDNSCFTIQYETSRMADDASKWRWALQTTRDSPKGAQKRV